jgi:hypothetical protein
MNKKMLLSKPVKVVLAGAGILGLFSLFSKVRAASPVSRSPLIITNHDPIYDYLFDQGQWFTRRKSDSTWLNMKDRLSAENYNLAISRLQPYLVNYV